MKTSKDREVLEDGWRSTRGRPKGSYSPENRMRRAHKAALITLAKAAEEGDVRAAIAVVEYNREHQQK
jgi:hypothetical protein